MSPNRLSSTRLTLPAAVTGVILLAITGVAGLAGDRADFFRAYLVGYTFWLGLGLGSLGGALIQAATGDS
jgi:hypothetical protein